MKILIPIAGRGTRLRPLTLHSPKAMLLVAGKRVIEHIVERLLPLQPSSFVIVRDPAQEAVESFLKSQYPTPFTFVLQREPKGLGEAVWLGLGVSDEPTLILLGDTIFEAPLQELVESPEAAIGLQEVEDPSRFGTVALQDGKIVQLAEKSPTPPSHLAIVGIYWIPRPHLLKEALHHTRERGIRTRGEFQLTDALQELVRRGETLLPFAVQGWYDCGTTAALLTTQAKLLQHEVEGTIEESTLIPPIAIAKGAKIVRSIVGPHVTVAEGCTISESQVTMSVLHEKTQVHQSQLTHSLLGTHVSLTGAKGRFLLGDYAQVRG